MKTVGALLIVAVLLAGCGQSGSTKAIEAKFSKLDYDMATIETGSTQQDYLARLTQQYIALTREYADELGDKEVKRRLNEKALELDDYCLPCAATVDHEAAKY
jgi:hypothetical protein